MIAWLAVIGFNLLLSEGTVVFDNQWLAKQTLDPGPSTFDLSWFQSDRLGSITGVADETGETQESYTYSAFGVRTPISHLPTSISNNLGFTGRELDPETGLYYYRARYYDPNIGRFISEDPIGFGAGDINKYRYVLNSALQYFDSYGLSSSAERGTIDASVSTKIRNCLSRFAVEVATDQAITGLYLVIMSNGNWYVGKSVDVERRIRQHGKRFLDAVYEPFEAIVDKTTLANLEEYLLQTAEQDLGVKGKQNKIRARSPLKYINPCD